MDLEQRFEALKTEARKRHYRQQEDFKADREDVRTAVAWGTSGGAPTPRLLLAAFEDGALGDTAANDVLSLAWQAPSAGATEPVAAMVVAGGEPRYFDLDPFAPHEIDDLPTPSKLSDLRRLQREPTFEWSLKVYERLQRGFDDFHEQVYSAVRDTVDGRNDIIDEVAKFVFLELYRLKHRNDKTFRYKSKKYYLDEVFCPEAVAADGKVAVERIKAAFDAFKGHPDYVITDEDGRDLPIFPADVHLKLSVPRNYETLIRLLQELPELHDNQGKKLRGQPTLDKVAGDVLGRAFDVFLRHKFQKEGVGIYMTPAPVKRAMVDIVLHDIFAEDYGVFNEWEAKGRPAFRVCDPAGGTLGFLTTLLTTLEPRLLKELNLSDPEHKELWAAMLRHSFVAADSSPRMVRLGRLNMALHRALKAPVYNVTNSLTTDRFQPNSFDLILTNPPFGAPKAKKTEEKRAIAELMEAFRSDVDFDAVDGPGGILRPTTGGLAMGAKPDGKGIWKEKDSGVDLSVLFLDRCLQLLKHGGRLVMIVPDSLLCNANTRYVREYLIGTKDEKTGQFHGGKAILKAVISLPADTFKLSGTGAKTSILYVQKRHADPKNPERFLGEPQTDVFMAVADRLGYVVKNNQESYSDAGVPNDLVPIVAAYLRGE